MKKKSKQRWKETCIFEMKSTIGRVSEWEADGIETAVRSLCLTNLEMVTENTFINSQSGFYPTNQREVFPLCWCDEPGAWVGTLGFLWINSIAVEQILQELRILFFKLSIVRANTHAHTRKKSSAEEGTKKNSAQFFDCFLWERTINFHQIQYGNMTV